MVKKNFRNKFLASVRNKLFEHSVFKFVIILSIHFAMYKFKKKIPVKLTFINNRITLMKGGHLVKGRYPQN